VIILASASPRRQALLRALGLEYRAVPSRAAESGPFPTGASRLTETLAYAKAADVAARSDTGLVLGADTVVECEGRVLGKPHDPDEARRLLRQLSGRAHLVVTGLVLVEAGSRRTEIGHDVTEVRMRPVTDAEIEAYVGTGEPFDKAGGYAIQGGARAFVEGIRGSYTNVMGLPLGKLRELLLRFGIDPLARNT
jgi:septum formation protein